MSQDQTVLVDDASGRRYTLTPPAYEPPWFPLDTPLRVESGGYVGLGNRLHIVRPGDTVHPPHGLVVS